MEENKAMTPEKSLEIISMMMNQGRKDTQMVFGEFMIIWGILIIAVALVVGYLWKVCDNPVWNALWIILPIGGFAWGTFLQKKKNAHKPNSFVSRTIGQIWMSVGIFCCVLGFGAAPIINFCNDAICQYAIAASSPVMVFPLCGVMMLFFGMAAVATGFILKDYLISICGFIAGFGGFAGCIICQHSSTMLVLAGVVLVSMIIPGLRIVIKNRSLCSSH